MRNRLAAAVLGAALFAISGSLAPAIAQDGGDGMGGPAPVPAPKPGEAAAPAPAPDQDVLVLKDGTEIRGRITAEDDSGYAVKVGGTLRVIEKAKVTEVRRAPRPAGDDVAGGAAGAPAPGGKGPSDGDGKEREKRRNRKRAEEGMPDAGSPPPPLTEDGKAWAKSCIERVHSPDPAVQRSAAEALRALGPSALPLVREARDAAADEPTKGILGKVVAMLEKAPMKGREGPDGRKLPGPDGGVPPEGKPGEPKPNPDMPKRGYALLDRVRTELALDDAQAKTVGPALLLYGRDVRDVLLDARDGLTTYEEARTKGAEMRTKLRDGLKATLTSEQLDKLDGILDEMGKRMGGGGPPKDKAPPKDAPPKESPPPK
jgi:hypothetical protein